MPQVLQVDLDPPAARAPEMELGTHPNRLLLTRRGIKGVAPQTLTAQQGVGYVTPEQEGGGSGRPRGDPKLLWHSTEYADKYGSGGICCCGAADIRADGTGHVPDKAPADTLWNLYRGSRFDLDTRGSVFDLETGGAPAPQQESMGLGADGGEDGTVPAVFRGPGAKRPLSQSEWHQLLSDIQAKFAGTNPAAQEPGAKWAKYIFLLMAAATVWFLAGVVSVSNGQAKTAADDTAESNGAQNGNHAAGEATGDEAATGDEGMTNGELTPFMLSAIVAFVSSLLLSFAILFSAAQKSMKLKLQFLGELNNTWEPRLQAAGCKPLAMGVWKILVEHNDSSSYKYKYWVCIERESEGESENPKSGGNGNGRAPHVAMGSAKVLDDPSA